MLPNTLFYNSLDYSFNDNGSIKKTELDIKN